MKINYNKISPKATDELIKLDDTFIGTPNYMGITYFWSYTYRHILREVPLYARQKVHTAFLKANLPVNEASEEHTRIINRVIFGNKQIVRHLKKKGAIITNELPLDLDFHKDQ